MIDKRIHNICYNWLIRLISKLRFLFGYVMQLAQKVNNSVIKTWLILLK